MWQNKFETRLELEPTPSRYLLIYLIVLHALAGAALLQPLTLPAGLHFVLLAAVAASLLWQVWRHYRDSQQTKQLIWRTDGIWDYRTDGQLWTDLALLPSTYITRGLIILHLQPVNGRRLYIVLLPDSLSRAQWHLLWLRLRYASPSGQGRVTSDE
ncbi:protein YgfX [Thiohalophilus sp.]|uniref:protein YgfX n=1 Tax=Thiohalophilus sp. TaxID=3028392 RepID=UPI002ACE0C31|nr:protein YgfX [Thiohalophilus sp.]MDZ7663137.1 protein YgfX [Thiohalophilus sp.]